MTEEPGVTLGVAGGCVLEVPDPALGHEEGRHRADAANPRLPRRGLREARLELRPAALELRVHRGVAQPPEHGEPGRGRERVSGASAPAW